MGVLIILTVLSTLRIRLYDAHRNQALGNNNLVIEIVIEALA